MQLTTDPDNDESGILGNCPRPSIHYLEGIKCRLSSKDERLHRCLKSYLVAPQNVG
jgi:hypothetical protein